MKTMEQEAEELVGRHYHEQGESLGVMILAALRRAEARGIRRAAELAVTWDQRTKLIGMADAVERGES